MSLGSLAVMVAGLLLLAVGAELLVRGASKLAAAVGLSPLVIGLTIVAYGTSAPELIVSVKSTLAGQPDIAMGNVVGSNLFNVLFILGVSGLILPLVVSVQLVRWDVPVMVGVSILVFLMSLDGTIGRLDGIILVAGAIAYTVVLLNLGRKEKSPGVGEFEREYAPEPAQTKKPGRIPLQILLIIAGLAGLVFGARWLIDGAIDLAKAIGVSELVISLTIVAAGTSLPEVFTSVVASIRGERDIAVGNVVGSNIFNILAILGICGVIAPGGVRVAPSVLRFDLPVMLAVAGACLPIFFTGLRISRKEAILFLFYYAAYTVYLILAAGRHDALPTYSLVMWEFVAPLTGLALLVIGLWALRKPRPA